MATLGSNYLTLADWGKRQDDDGKTALIVDLLSQTNEWLTDMPWIEGNQTSGHKTTVRTGLPQGTWRMLYQGVQPTKSTTAQIVENCGNLEGYSEVDKDLADLNGNTNDFRLSEDSAFFEGLSQQFSTALAYSSTVGTPAQIMGLAPRYNSKSASVATSANVLDAGGAGSTNTSIWFVGWGANSVHGIFPKGKRAGLNMEDLGRWTKQNADGSLLEVYRSHFKWENGLCVRDWRYVVRICNIDVTALSGGSAANLINLLIIAGHKFPTAPSYLAPANMPTRPSGVVGPANFAIYCNRTVSTALDIQATNKTNVLLKMEEWDGKPVTSFRGVPVRTVDSILNTEARVV